jgi:hypothetical protein
MSVQHALDTLSVAGFIEEEALRFAIEASSTER